MVLRAVSNLLGWPAPPVTAFVIVVLILAFIAVLIATLDDLDLL